MIEEFIVRAVERAGGAVAPRAPGVLDALVPAALDPDRAEREVAIATSPAVLAREPGAQLATIGSPFLDAIIAHVSRLGTTTAGYLPVDRIRKKGLREAVERTLCFSNCRVRYDSGEPEVLCAHMLQFNFRATFLSDEKREHLFVVPVNLWSNQPVAAFAGHVAAVRPAADRPPGIADASSVTVKAAYGTARRAMSVRLRLEAHQHQARLRKRFGVEYLRIDEYYRQVVDELDRRESHGAHGRAETIAAKREASLGERERKLRELGAKYRLRVQVRLVSARRLAQPKSFFRLFIDRAAKTRTLILAYDSLLDRLEPPCCDACAGEMTDIRVTSEARLLCGACAGK